jgi:hypothetical protein
VSPTSARKAFKGGTNTVEIGWRSSDARRELANTIAQIEHEIAEGEQACREVISELEFVLEHTPDQAVEIRFDCARRAIKLRNAIPRVQSLLARVTGVAGEKALKEAEAPPQFLK